MMSYKIAIIGSGPSAFYAAQEIFKSEQTIAVDMFEKLPTPYGLLRGGVAPDHQQMKTISKSYDKIASHPNFRFFGNVTVGESVSVDELTDRYHAVIIAIGAQTDRQLNIPGEDAIGSHTATEFVAWYNGHPDYQSSIFDLSKRSAVIIGQGNVAVDVTRILAKSTDELKQTDITNQAISILENSQLTDIYMIGRRGPAQAACTELELKELAHIHNVNVQVHHDLVLSENDQLEMDASSKVRKNIQQLTTIKATGALDSARKTIHLMFYLTPVEIIKNGQNIQKIRFEKNKMQGDFGHQKAVPTGEFIVLDCDILFRSIGYRGVPLNGVPFDQKSATIPNQNGQVLEDNGNPCQKLFVTGWIKRGPSGVIGTNRSDSIETVRQCLASIESTSIAIDSDVQELLELKNIRSISFHDWKMIDEYEQAEGKRVGKPREKLTNIDDVFNVLNNGVA